MLFFYLPGEDLTLARLIESNKLPYISVVNLLPPTMTVHMSPETRRSLTPSVCLSSLFAGKLANLVQSPPSTLELNRHVRRLAKYIYLEHAIEIPELNTAPVLWRAVRAILGTRRHIPFQP